MDAKVQEFDFIVIGEGEETFKSLLNELKGNRSLINVPGIAYRRKEEVIINPPIHKLDLREIPSPYRFEEDLPELGKTGYLY